MCWDCYSENTQCNLYKLPGRLYLFAPLYYYNDNHNLTHVTTFLSIYLLSKEKIAGLINDGCQSPFSVKTQSQIKHVQTQCSGDSLWQASSWNLLILFIFHAMFLKSITDLLYMMRNIADDVHLWRLWWSAGSLCIWFSAFILPLGFLFHKPCPCPVTREFPAKPTLMICIYCNLRYLLWISYTVHICRAKRWLFQQGIIWLTVL